MAVVEMQANHDEAIEAQRAKMSFLFREDVAPGLRLEMDLNKIFFTGESEFQQVDYRLSYHQQTDIFQAIPSSFHDVF